MSTIDQGYAAELKAANLTVALATPDAARWAAQGVSASALSPFADPAGAAAEAARRAAFLAGPLVRDRAVVQGEQRALIGRCIRLAGTDLGYSAGELVFVVGVAEQDNGTTVLTVLRRLT